jgi:butyryl-CoA dehydrogenase
MIYEGTNTIQSLDLLGCKVLMDNGAKLKKFGAKVQAFIEENGADEAMSEFITPLADLGDKVSKLTMEIGMKAFQNPDEAGAAAVPYLRVVGHLVYAYFFAQMAKIALAKQDSGDKFYVSKLATARFYFARLLPETAMLIRQARSGSASLMALDADLF